MRNLIFVIQQLIEHNPGLESHLHAIRQSALYAAPEMQSHWWRETARHLQTYELEHEQDSEMQNIFIGKESA